MRSKNNGEQNVGKTSETFPKEDKNLCKAPDMTWTGPIQDVQTTTIPEFSIPLPKENTERYWLVLYRYTYNNKITKKIIIADNMRQAVEDFEKFKEPCEEFLMISEIEKDALSVIAYTL